MTRRIAAASLRWLVRFARPRAVSEGLALIFVLLSLVTLAVIAGAAVWNARTPGSSLAWVVVLLVLALAARLAPQWGAELKEMTRERARMYTGSALLVFVALSFSWHLLAGTLGLDDAYLLLGPLSRSSGAVAVLIGLAVVAGALLLGLPVGPWSAALWRQGKETAQTARAARTIEFARVDQIPVFEPVEEEPERERVPEQPETRPAPALAPEKKAAVQPALAQEVNLPPVELFAAPTKGPAPKVDLDHLERQIEETLASFHVSARVVGHHYGPAVTQFDVQPDRGVKVKSITALQNDLALALAAPTIRIQAPVPGKPVVGIEIPNSSAALVTLRELLESEQFRSTKSPLRVPLGKDVAGTPGVIDLARMPHLLIAGATGSGKSACVNSLISSLLYQNSPEQVRLMMIDPKMVELTVYNGVPHLLSPVVTQMDRVVGVLQWALREMERRYNLFAETTVRNINRFNEKADSLGLKQLPYIVLIIDELADLMMVSPEDVEDAICRLAQLARAAGIHLVIATQRPSVDVVTGLIKANFPARIAFAMTSQVDSRTILDTAGAEKLLGRGDMLYLPPDAPKPVRLQGAYVSDNEIERLVEFWHTVPLQQAIQKIADEEFVAAAKEAAEVDDELLGEATRLVREGQYASVTLLQRRLRVGYARAARLMDQLESRGVVGPADGSKQRTVLEATEAD